MGCKGSEVQILSSRPTLSLLLLLSLELSKENSRSHPKWPLQRHSFVAAIPTRIALLFGSFSSGKRKNTTVERSSELSKERSRRALIASRDTHRRLPDFSLILSLSPRRKYSTEKRSCVAATPTRIALLFGSSPSGKGKNTTVERSTKNSKESISPKKSPGTGPGLGEQSV